MSLVAPGNALLILDASPSGAKAPTPKRLADAVVAAGGVVRQFKSPKGGALAGWIEAEARERSLTLAPGTAKLLAERVGGFVQEGDAERRHQTRIASMELDKLATYRGAETITPDDVQALVAEAVPGSVWAFTDAVGKRRVEPALDMLDRLFETTPEPVLLAVLHRRVRELLETGDRLNAGERLPAVGKAMGVASEFRMETATRPGEGLDDRRADGRAGRAGRARRHGQGCRGRGIRRRATTPGVQSVGDRPRGSSTATERVTAGATRRSTVPDDQWPEDQACSWTTRSLSIANTQRPSPRSSSSISSGSMYSCEQSSHSPPGMPKHSRSLRSGRRNVVSNRVVMSRRAQAGQRSRTAIAGLYEAAARHRHDPTVTLLRY